MANSLKKKTPLPPDPEELNPDKDADVTVAEVVKDERTEKIIGSVCLLLTVFLFISFTSYLFTWQEDQDKVQQFGVRIFSTDDVRVNNLLGVLGAYVSHTLWYNGFGLASYLFCTVFFVLGVNLLFGKKVFKLLRNLKYVLVGLVVFSMAASFIDKGASFSWGGAVGEYLNDWFEKWIGKIGTGALLLLTLFSYFIWRFNPVFNIPNWKFNLFDGKEEPMSKNLAADLPEEPVAVDNLVFDDLMEQTSTDDLDEDGLPISKNKLKSNASGVSVIMPAVETTINPMNEFDMVEKEELVIANEEEEEPEEELIEDPDEEFEEELEEAEEELITAIEKTQKEPELELEIKETPEAEEEETLATIAATVGSLASKYDVTLDLKNYKYPGLELLETHGSEKIVHDPTELETHKNQIIATLKNY
ncbi:MAG: DNA translocase FtsK 4TM domain-containing protein, partial [Sediminibacterium sp.]|nr:DNA translocase FtsK 4TM domain-containing protein [Sediminibacterium sp.]